MRERERETETKRERERECVCVRERECVSAGCLEVSIAIGTWSCTRFEGDASSEVLPVVRLTGDVPRKWQ